MLDMKEALDLKALIATTNLEAGDYLTSRYKLPAADEAATFELVAPLGQGHVDAIVKDTFIFVLNGKFSINETLHQKDEGIKITAGTAFHWVATPDTYLFVMSVLETESAEPGVVSIDPFSQMTSSLPPPVEYLTGPIPTCQSATAWRSCSGQFYGGIWASTPYSRKKIPYVHDEFMYLLEGSVKFTTDSGKLHTFKAGDAFLICRGAICSWDSQENVKKMYVIFRPS